MSKCLITVEGGLGKNVMFTSILKKLAEKYDEVYVISPYYDVFKSCSYVTDAFPMGQGNLYQDIALDEDCDILWREPYSNGKFIKKQCHLFDAWAEELNFELDTPAMQCTPVLDKIEDEFYELSKQVEAIKKELGKFILVQFTGGQSPLAPVEDKDGKLLPYMNAVEGLKRNYHRAQQLIDLLHKEYPDAKIIHFALKNEPEYENAQKLVLPYLAYHLLAKDAFKVVCTDSSLQHLVTGVCKDVTVIWGETRPEHFGYDCNKNICAKAVKNTQPYFKPLGMSPAIVKFPTPEEVMEVVKKDIDIKEENNVEENV